MKDVFENYIQSISSKFSHDETSEMGYRTDFELLLRKTFDGNRIGHDTKAKQGNKPDFIVFNKEIPILYIETKDIGVSLDKIEKSKQMARYYGYANLVLTDYVEFRFYRNGISYGEPIKIADYDLKERTIEPLSKNYINLAKVLLDFTKSHKEPIRSGKHLAKIMGGKAQRIRNDVRLFFSRESTKETDLIRLYETLKESLVHDLTPDSFADMYAQTLVYGLFVARYHDKTSGDFSRQEARELIPNSNPFLRHFFDHIVGADFDKRLKYIVDELCEVFSHADVTELMDEYFKNGNEDTTHVGTDPVIHFYEDFLKEYDPILRKKMGAYYTPQPVVQFIIKSVDILLRKEFGLSGGLGDKSKTKEGVHKVQILDPAVGTGTFISAIIDNIYARFKKRDQAGRWPAYVHRELLPRLHGFELMMAPYTIAHLKLGIAFRKTGFWTFHRRLGIYLTNSLEGSTQQKDLFAFGLAESIAKESKEAAVIKNSTPIMVVVGNPPYSVSSSNKGEWIRNLIKVYKKDLNERNIQPLSDDYIKFLRFAEHFIEKNGSGIVAMITNNSFLDGIIHRQMRKHLLETFDDIYILDLHGSSKKKETSPDGSKDENVFDIQQGVSINIFVRKEREKKGLGSVHHADLYGKRIDKFEQLNKNNTKSIKWQKLDYTEPYYFFVPKDFELIEEYEKGFKVDALFEVNSVGIVTSRDRFVINIDKKKLVKKISNITNINISDSEFEKKYQLKTKYFDPTKARHLSINNKKAKLLKCFYRPMDIRWLFYDTNFIERDRKNVMKHMINVRDNIALVCSKQTTKNHIDNIQVTNSVIELKFNSHDRNSNIFPLYLYANDSTKTPNLKKEIVDEVEKIVGKITPENIFDYIYAVLHSPNYRERYKEFLKIDFPRVPYPKDKSVFKKLVKLGTALRALHLLESPKVNNFITTYPIAGSDIVEKRPEYKNGKVFINEAQYFGKVPEKVWDFYVGGYQPAQKWLKDRKGRTLTNEDIEHYQKIIVALNETIKIMEKVDKTRVIGSKG